MFIRLCNLFLALLLATGPAFADAITLPYSYSPGQVITAAKLNANNLAITDQVNGNLNDANIKVGAAIAPTKIDFTQGCAILRAAAANCLTVGTTGDTVPRLAIDSEGDIHFGPGGGTARDIQIMRKAGPVIAIRNEADSADADLTVKAITASGALQATALTLTTTPLTPINGGSGNNVAATLGTILVGDGTKFAPIGPGTSGQYIRSNGTTFELGAITGGLYGDGADGAKTISSNTTETVPKIFRCTTLTINTGCTWTVKSGTLILCTGAVDIQGTGKIVVSADIQGGVGGTATTRFRATGGGPSPGSCDTAHIYYVPGGAGCGGAGGDGGYIAAGSASGGKGGAAVYPYPGVTGSGGGAGAFCGNPSVPGNGGAGGGSVGLYSGSTITIGASAKIQANGGAGTAQSDNYGVAGSGGSGGVVDVGALTSITNSGTIEAKGGAGGNAVNSGYYAPGGGGGIVCLTSASVTAGTVTLTGGAVGSGGAAHDVVPTAGSTGVSYSTTAIPVKYRCF